MTTVISVANDGTKTYSVRSAVPLPTSTKVRDAAKAVYPFNTMKVGDFFPVADADAAKAAYQAFRSEIYAPARAVGKLVTRSLKKAVALRQEMSLGEEAYGVWLMANDEPDQG